jgi:hypothetical protein
MQMVGNSYHEMVLDKYLEDGSQEWYCPTCGRRFILKAPPSFEKIVLAPGDEMAIHAGGNGGLKKLPVDPCPEEAAEERFEPSYESKELRDLLMDDPYLEPWSSFLGQIKFNQVDWQDSSDNADYTDDSVI